MRGLYVIVDPEFCLLEPLAVATAALRGGCAALQLRSKQLDDADFLALGHALVRACRTHDVPFLVNDRVELVPALGADGVHVGQGDAPIELVRARLGARALIGVSTHSLDQARDAERRGASWIGFGPVFATQSKANPDPVVGLSGLRATCAGVAIPVIAIGGIDEQNAASVAEAAGRAVMGAVISAVCRASDPERAARALHRGLGG